MRILFLSHFIPHPPTGGASLRNFNIVKELTRKHEVHVLTFTQMNRHPTQEKIEASRRYLEQYCASVTILNVPTDHSRLRWYAMLGFNLFSPRPYSMWRFWSNEMKEALGRAIAANSFDIVHVDTIALAAYRAYLHGLPAVLNHHNIESTLLLRRAATEKSLIKRWYLNLQGRKLRSAEKRAIVRFDGNICVSELDCEELRSLGKGALCRVVPNGTDVDFFRPVEAKSEGPSLVFAGSMTWYPNSDAMTLFAERIWPLIKEQIPGIVMNVIGSYPPAEVVRLSQSDHQFKVLGFVDDVRPYISRASVYVVPIRVGGGTRLKILDAMAMGKAIVSHPIGAEGLYVIHGKDIVIAEDPKSFADEVVELVHNEAKRRALATQARQTVVERYSWQGIVPVLEKFYHEVADGRGAKTGTM